MRTAGVSCRPPAGASREAFRLRQPARGAALGAGRSPGDRGARRGVAGCGLALPSGLEPCPPEPSPPLAPHSWRACGHCRERGWDLPALADWSSVWPDVPLPPPPHLFLRFGVGQFCSVGSSEDAGTWRAGRATGVRASPGGPSVPPLPEGLGARVWRRSGQWRIRGGPGRLG